MFFSTLDATSATPGSSSTTLQVVLHHVKDLQQDWCVAWQRWHPNEHSRESDMDETGTSPAWWLARWLSAACTAVKTFVL